MTVDQSGSPAHAGIDRRFCHLTIFGPWFPRTRGDRPTPVPIPTAPQSFPRTRGDRPYSRMPVLTALPVPPHTRG